MPGTKIELKGGDDPDPCPYLYLSEELKQKIAEKPYDPKRSCYVPHAEEKFCEGLIEETNGNKVKVKIVVGESKGDVKEYKQDLVAQVNPPKVGKKTKIYFETNFCGPVRLLRGYVKPDLPERRLCAVQPEGPLRRASDLHLLRPLLYRSQPVQAVPHLHHENCWPLPRQEEERGASSHLRHRRGFLPLHVSQ